MKMEMIINRRFSVNVASMLVMAFVCVSFCGETVFAEEESSTIAVEADKEAYEVAEQPDVEVAERESDYVQIPVVGRIIENVDSSNEKEMHIREDAVGITSIEDYVRTMGTEGGADTYTYDDKGRLDSIKHTQYFEHYGNSARVVKPYVIKCHYDDKGRLTKTVAKVNKTRGRGWVPGYTCGYNKKTDYKYDAKGRLAKKICYDKYRDKDNKLRSVKRVHRYSYDSKGQMVKETDSFLGKKIIRKYTYNKIGYIKKKTVIFPANEYNDLKKKTCTYSYTKDENGNIAIINATENTEYTGGWKYSNQSKSYVTYYTREILKNSKETVETQQWALINQNINSALPTFLLNTGNDYVLSNQYFD